MAAMAGSWLALTWGFGGLRVHEGRPALAPRLPAAWTRYRFGLRWRDAQLRVEVDRSGVRYSLDGEQRAALRSRRHRAVHRARSDPALSADRLRHGCRARLKAVIFDLDGVIADTAVVHHAAWKQLAGEIGVDFDEATGERMKGVDRRGSLDILLERAARPYSEDEKASLAARKNDYYREQIAHFGPQHLLPGARAAVESSRQAGLRVGLASASRNAPLLLERLGIAELFDYVVDAGRISRSKPDPGDLPGRRTGAGRIALGLPRRGGRRGRRGQHSRGGDGRGSRGRFARTRARGRAFTERRRVRHLSLHNITANRRGACVRHAITKRELVGSNSSCIPST